MKKYLFITAIALAALASCAKNSPSTEAVADRQVNFTPAVGKTVKTTGPVSGTVLPADESFYSIAYFKASGSASDSSRYMPLSKVSYSDGSWTTETKYYWPKSNGSELSFFSIYPASVIDEGLFAYTAGIQNGWESKTDYDVDAHQDYDLMIADAATGCDATNSGSGVTTTFRHKLAYIKGITIKTDTVYSAVETFTLNSIKNKGILHNGQYTYNSWTAGEGTVDVTLHEGDVEFSESGVSASITDNGYYFVLPQTIPGDAYMEIVYTVTQVNSPESKDVVTKNLYFNPDLTLDGDGVTVLKAFEMNKAYTFTIEVGNQPIKWRPDVADWTEETFNGSLNK